MTHANDPSDPATWDPALDAALAAPKHHKVIFENDRLRVLRRPSRFPTAPAP
jgi:hypothetical protein